MTQKELFQKVEYYCAYQERCHDEVLQKLRDLGVETSMADEAMGHLIANNFLNEERFACSFARGKHRIKHWGRIRITAELKMRHISAYNIKKALAEITEEEYNATFDTLAHRQWLAIKEKNSTKKRAVFYDYLYRRGFESQLIYDKLKELEKI
jgi:regulatory protein